MLKRPYPSIDELRSASQDLVKARRRSDLQHMIDLLRQMRVLRPPSMG